MPFLTIDGTTHYVLEEGAMRLDFQPIGSRGRSPLTGAFQEDRISEKRKTPPLRLTGPDGKRFYTRAEAETIAAALRPAANRTASGDLFNGATVTVRTLDVGVVIQTHRTPGTAELVAWVECVLEEV